MNTEKTQALANAQKRIDAAQTELTKAQAELEALKNPPLHKPRHGDVVLLGGVANLIGHPRIILNSKLGQLTAYDRLMVPVNIGVSSENFDPEGPHSHLYTYEYIGNIFDNLDKVAEALKS
jgi:hypothetical protein